MGAYFDINANKLEKQLQLVRGIHNVDGYYKVPISLTVVNVNKAHVFLTLSIILKKAENPNDAIVFYCKILYSNWSNF